MAEEKTLYEVKYERPKKSHEEKLQIIQVFERVQCNLQQGSGLEMLSSMMNEFGAEDVILVARWLQQEKQPVYGSTIPTHLPHVHYTRDSWTAFIEQKK